MTTEATTETSTENSTTEQSKVDLAETGATATTTETEDTRTAEEKAADEKVAAEKAELFGAPEGDEGYKIEGLPEGMEIDKAALDAIAPVAKELNLSSKGLSSIAKVYAEKVLPGVMERTTGTIEQQVVAQRAEWEGQSEAAIKANGADLKNVAGETLSFDAKDKDGVLKTAAKALDRLAPQGFRDFLKDTGLSQHPAMVAFAYQAGKLLAEDTDLDTADKGAKPKSRVEKYYG